LAISSEMLSRSRDEIATRPGSAPLRRRPAASVGGLLRLAPLLGALMASGCYHYRAAPPDLVPSTEPESRTVWSYAWGLVQQNVQPPSCQGVGLSEVTVSTNFGFTLLTVLTLGFVSPATVEWRCAKDVPCPGDSFLPSPRAPAKDSSGAGR